jgi:glutamate-5-semialdehyde dehydrogenase
MADDVRDLARAARDASRALGRSTEAQRNSALEAIAVTIENNVDTILEANEKDIKAAEPAVAEGKLSKALVDRLRLSESKVLNTIALGVRSVKNQADPIGRTESAMELDEGLKLYRVSVPIGVLGVIFESRPDALVQIATLCLKSGNAVLLKGGSEAFHSNRALSRILIEATRGLDGIPDGWMHQLEAREDVQSILDMHDCIDLIIPRGGNELVQHIMSNTKIPVMGHADGICHVYIDKDADVEKATRIALDAKIDSPSGCNAVETLLVHSDIAERALPTVVKAMQDHGVEVRGDERTRSLVPGAGEATETDWETEYLDLVVAVRVVDDFEQAVDHINTYGSHHTDSIVTENKVTASRFLQGVDAASVLHNASTRFADGFRYGLGAEVGISTNRLHSRGPVGLEGLMIYKYVIEGDGHTAGTYQGDDAKAFTHRPLDEVWKAKG